MFAVPDQEPAHVSPPAAIAGRVRIARQIGFLVMDAMCRNPENRPAFESQCAANSKKILKGQRHLIRPVRVQPVVPHADSQSGGEPQQEQGDRQVRPTEHKQRANGARVQDDESQGGLPVQPLLCFWKLDEIEIE